MQIRIIIVWALAAVLLADSVLRSFRSNFNFGLLLMYLLTAALWAYAVFHRPIDAFCAEGVGRWLKMLFFCGAGAGEVNALSTVPQQMDQIMREWRAAP